MRVVNSSISCQQWLGWPFYKGCTPRLQLSLCVNHPYAMTFKPKIYSSNTSLVVVILTSKCLTLMEQSLIKNKDWSMHVHFFNDIIRKLFHVSGNQVWSFKSTHFTLSNRPHQHTIICHLLYSQTLELISPKLDEHGMWTLFSGQFCCLTRNFLGTQTQPKKAICMLTLEEKFASELWPFSYNSIVK